MQVRKQISFDHSDLEWCMIEYPGVEMSTIVALLLHEFRSVHFDVGLTPAKAARDAAKELIQKKKEGVIPAFEKAGDGNKER